MRGAKETVEEDPTLAEIYELREKVRNAGMPQKVEEIANKEINRLERMNPISAEYTVTRTYLDYIVTMPWNKKTVDNLGRPVSLKVQARHDISAIPRINPVCEAMVAISLADHWLRQKTMESK